MQEVSMQVLTIAIGINSVSRIDEHQTQFRGSSARRRRKEFSASGRDFKAIAPSTRAGLSKRRDPRGFSVGGASSVILEGTLAERERRGIELLRSQYNAPSP